MFKEQGMARADTPQAAWIRDSGEWRILVPPDLAKPGAMVTVARADGSHVREVTIPGRDGAGVEGQACLHD